MIINEFKDKLFREAEKTGFSEFEIYYESGENLDINAYKQQIDRYNVNKTLGISFRGLYNGKMGYAYTETMDEGAVLLLVQQAKSNAEIIEKEGRETIFGGSEKYQEFNGYNEDVKKVTIEEKIKLALKLEEEIYGYSDKVTNTRICKINFLEKEKRIINSKGLNLSAKSNAITTVAISVATKEGKAKTGLEFNITNNIHEINISQIAKNSVEDALKQFGASPVKSGKYRVMIINSASTLMMLTFAGIFSADNAQKGLSLLNGKVGERVGSKVLTITDDPFIMGSMNSSFFDAEGVATSRKDIIDKGQLKTLLHNLETAAKDGVESTGNASKASFSSSIEVAPTNLCIQPGTKSCEELIKVLQDGIIITSVEGTNTIAGANPISGDFSLAAEGFLVEHGRIIRPVEQITLSGNYFELMRNVEEVGTDVKKNIRLNLIGSSPSIIINELSVAGE